MQRWTIGARLAVATTIVAATGAAITPGLAHATGPTTGITVFLKGPDNAALQRLADAHGLTHAQRVRALTQLLPTAAEHAQAVAALRDEGMKVTDQNAWSVTATAPSSTVTQAFGTHAIAHAHPTAAEQAAAVGPYPTMPITLQDVATAVYPTTGGPAAFHAADDANDSCDNCLGGADFRNAYAAPSVVPSAGLDTAATLTIATIQLDGWNTGDLTNWANTPGNVVGPAFNEPQDLTVVPVDQAAVPPPTKGDIGDEEVDLDQETLLGTDPYAHQRPYFAPNTSAGIADAYSQLVDDVLQDSHSYQGGDAHIVAVSSSWGICEADNGLKDIKVMEPILESVVAAGVTIFSSSGDNGIYDDCDGLATDVDYPAASPEAVSVGGTNLFPTGSSTPNNGSNWAEQAWSCSSKSDCLAQTPDSDGGSGGGISAVFAKPAYQSQITNAPFSGVRMRMVPDISADGDPATGFRIYTTDPTDTFNHGANYRRVGGTSLATPVSAALFTNMLAAHGATTGIGDIHQGLYNAYAANVGAFRDITKGSNGATADAGADPSVYAGTGYDTVTGLGAPLWSALASYLFAAKPVLPPKSTGSLTLAHPNSATQARQVTASWGSTMSASSIALAGASVTVTRDGQAQPIYANTTASPSGTYSFAGVAGATYQIAVVSADVTGAKSKQAVATLSVPIDDKAFKFSGSWQRVASGSDYAGSMATSYHKNSYATATAAGSTYELLVPVGPSFGKLRVSWNGFKLMTINQYARTRGSRLVDIFDSGLHQSRTFKFTVLGRTALSSPSTSTTIGLDALVAAY